MSDLCKCVYGAAVILTAALPLAAQRPRDVEGGRPQGRELERRFRERLAVVVKERVGLSDEQMTKLQETNQRFEARRRSLLLKEREARIGLRAELMGAAAPNEDKVRQLLDDTFAVRRSLDELLMEEQADMARYMSPSQRARFLGIQEQMRRRIEEMRPPDDLMPGDRGSPDGAPMRRPGIRRRPA